ncbi:hypothetical protein CDD83_10489 [Cordyceps sp. RAO-2017]|nr:hypothetical protein CDD83_10489 [Cordyceps sp. RAO-2017]
MSPRVLDPKAASDAGLTFRLQFRSHLPQATGHIMASGFTSAYLTPMARALPERKLRATPSDHDGYFFPSIAPSEPHAVHAVFPQCRPPDIYDALLLGPRLASSASSVADALWRSSADIKRIRLPARTTSPRDTALLESFCTDEAGRRRLFCSVAEARLEPKRRPAWSWTRPRGYLRLAAQLLTQRAMAILSLHSSRSGRHGTHYETRPLALSRLALTRHAWLCCTRRQPFMSRHVALMLQNIGDGLPGVIPPARDDIGLISGRPISHPGPYYTNRNCTEVCRGRLITYHLRQPSHTTHGPCMTADSTMAQSPRRPVGVIMASQGQPEPQAASRANDPVDTSDKSSGRL